ncbi:S1C family serine protease [Tuwongella immobilis]|uniref:PDZ domain-containing protein n=1 Tax=Tuwongella immobilis TaxID=692036 RepID=A0A6C2YUU8_9BACT|nr:trypsin-like peptidase domain-containing protein [Tuwongella immobilis]VIP05224.1 protease do : Peptidase S1 and S6 chymotrypsin/Hap OS=Planctomyces brasiliensis (strain ATCC 49424 / DSM 5305 / JCM 21570 / NBRC 103401 / IFAM 1448) GN=Plabr_0103 PE=4 SV=1: Trypsin_2: PDZ_2 [Tuwongella immobilis]VTS07804.1 protease do : Peptidase S1 and S6 chymotrypsin/Hap OS=Planctomyces brasiliensis (strain ATCC 49424 / DSM 5305 / JCM 21570 / NBRC 103401 / IFAM 1448) GN=Plabr_0103 PE=4 SV=1: Trypsin_2: PDZ_2 [
MKRIMVTLFCGGMAFAGGMVGSLLVNKPGSQAIAQSPPPMAPPPQAYAQPGSIPLAERLEEVSRQFSPAVVSIEATKLPSPTATGAKAGRPVEESGSGVITQFEGIRGTFVITNNHVVSNAPASQITVHLADDRLVKPVQVWTDPESDVAVLQLDVPNLAVATLGDSDRMRVGNWVLAFGSPFGLNQTVTHGIISARERGQISLGNTIRIKDFLQTDAAINPGSSGGPLVNLSGEVIGINTAIASQSGSNSGVAFAIPINMVKRVARQLLEKGQVSRGYLGVQLSQTLDANDAFKLGLDKAQGAWVEVVHPETPAALAGLLANDVILQLDTVPIRNENHLINLVSGLPVGQRVRLQVWRERRMMTVDVLIGDWAAAQARLKSTP